MGSCLLCYVSYRVWVVSIYLPCPSSGRSCRNADRRNRDLVEPVTYLAGLTTIMGGYLWFLYISKDLSYKAAMNVTVSRRQDALYEARGFDLRKWESLVQEANALSREIKVIAVEYDVDWDEAKDVGDDVKEVLDEERTKKGEEEPSQEKEKDEKFTEEERRKMEESKKS